MIIIEVLCGHLILIILGCSPAHELGAIDLNSSLDNSRSINIIISITISKMMGAQLKYLLSKLYILLWTYLAD